MYSIQQHYKSSIHTLVIQWYLIYTKKDYRIFVKTEDYKEPLKLLKKYHISIV